MSTIQERLSALRALMQQRGVDAVLVPTDDFHGSEYVGEYFKCRKYITGFTGSAGTAVIMRDMAGLWTDGRYFLQAERQLKDTGITLFRMGEEGVPTVQAFLTEQLSDGQTLAFDGRTMSALDGEKLCADLDCRHVHICYEDDLVGQIWPDRPALSCRPAWELDTAYTGASRADKLADLRRCMAEKHADVHVLTSLDDIAWLLNIRGDDVACNPVVLSYLIMTQEHVTFFVQEEAVDDALRGRLEADGITLAPYDTFYSAVSELPDGSHVLASRKKINYTLRCLLGEHAELIDADNPTFLAKAVKNAVEMENIRKAHVRDGVAVTRFIYWLKNHPDDEAVTELSAAEKLEELRREGEHYLGPSFDPIIAYAGHASIIHYSATEETDVPVGRCGMILCDTGGQYLEGTTDITRTVVLGEISAEEKEMFTRVLRGNLNLGAARFQKGCSGIALDYLARQPLWEIGLDYRHGTGHGVGFCLNVHEGPNSFHWKMSPSRQADTVLLEGMLTSNEPGYYKDNAYGIRHENLMLTRQAEKTAYGQFMAFETVTLVPFDLDGVDPALLNDAERQALNTYHEKVWEAISPYLAGDELTWLRQAARAI